MVFRALKPRLLLCTLLALLSTDCENDDPPATKPTIRIANNRWLGSEINATIAAKLIAKELNYPVEIEVIDEYAQWAKIARGELDACLEVWPSGHQEEYTNYVKTGLVQDVGKTGPVGKIGWYIPDFFAQKSPAAKSWEGFKDQAIIDALQTAETTPKGRFLGVDPTYVQYDQEIIDNLGLNLKVVFTGSEKALIDEIENAFSKNTPILFYFWTPHPIINQYNLVKVELPAYSDDCYATIPSGGVNCDYPADYLYKIVTPNLAKSAPQVYSFFTRFSYSTATQIELMALVTNGTSVDQVASDWITKNPAKWQPWVAP